MRNFYREKSNYVEPRDGREDLEFQTYPPKYMEDGQYTDEPPPLHYTKQTEVPMQRGFQRPPKNPMIYTDPRFKETKSYLDGDYQTGPGFNSENTELVDPAGSDTLTFETTRRHVDPSGQTYQDPFSDLYNLDEGQTYIAPSLAPKSGLKDPNAPLPADISPVDWKMGNTLDPERNQRSIVRQYYDMKYGKVADPSKVEEARKYADRMNTIGNVGHALDRMFTSASVAHKGPGADAAFWSGLKQQGQQAIQGAEADKRAQIEDYLTRKKLGSEGVQELGQMRELDRKAAFDNPQSEVSQRYQTLFARRYPEYAEQIRGVPASEIEVFAKYLQDKEKMDIDAKERADRAAYQNQQNKLAEDRLELDRDKADAQEKYNQDMIDIKRSEGQGASWPYLQNAPTSNKVTGGAEKPQPTPKIPVSILNNAIKEKKEYESYQKVKADALKAYESGGEYGLIEGNIPSMEIFGKRIGKKSEYDAWVAKIAAQIVEKVPGIRSDADFVRVVKPLLPSPGDPKDTIQTKKKIFQQWLESKVPETTTFNSLPEDMRNSFGGLSSGLSEKDQQALKWANENPDDPRSAKIKEKLGVK